jgi:glycosyltransferase involved in cell wall biosynthesis
MPFSFEQGKQFTRNIVGRVKHERMLDIGPGSGTYAKLFPDAKWTGIEIFKPYVEQYGLKDLYEEIIIGDVRDYDLSTLGRFDVAIAGDVLEHMTAEDAVLVVEKLKAVADTVIVSIPIGHHPQGEWEGNVHETHVVDDWSDEEFRKVFGQPTWGAVDDCIGVYCWSNQKIMPKICVYTIAKNEEMFVERWAKSAQQADLLLIADTGSTDKTVELAKKHGVMVQEICVTPWRFDHARNASLALIPKDFDVCICMDMDEVLEPGWRQEIERLWTPSTTHLRYKFDWSSGIVFYSEKIHARHGYYWHHPCHEHIRADGRITEVWAQTDFLLISHHPDPTKSRGHYLETLELSVKEDPYCPRNAFYYARELFYYCRWDEAIASLQRYLKMPEATWVNDRAYAMRLIGECFAGKGDQGAAESWYHKAAAEAPHTREPWMALTKLYYEQGRWAECYGTACRALSITHKQLVYTTDPAAWGWLPHDFAAIAAWRLGLQDVALSQGQTACDLAPEDARLAENLKWYKGEIA